MPWASRRAVARAGRRGWEWIVAVDRFVRLHLAFFTATWALLGAASVARRTTAGELAALLGVALCFHIYAYVLNDVVDLPIDRTEPARRRDPLVRGVIGPRQALLVALLQPVLTIPLTASLGEHPAADGTLAAGFALMGAYNVWGKRCPFPPLTDAVQGLAWGSLAVYAAQALGMAPTALTWMVAAYATVFTVFINGIHGSFRDLANDLASGARTTAIFFGARPAAAPGERHVPTALSVYAWSILAILIGMNAVLLLRNDFKYGVLAWVTTASVVGALNVCAVVLQPKVLRPCGSAPDVEWRLQMYVMLTALPIAFAAHASIEVLTALALLNAFAIVLFECTSTVARWAWLTMRALLYTMRGDSRFATRTAPTK